MDERVPNIMTVDVEDWFHILEVDGSYTREDWPGLESRVERNTDRLLELFDEAGVHSTFFVVGWVAERHPGLVRRIAEAGHELGSHSYWHEVLGRHDRRSLSADLGRSRSLLEDLGRAPVRGFRAPGASITPDSAWAFDVMLEQGYEYDSSMCPGYSSHGGFSSPHSGPHRLRCSAGELVEIPSSTVGVGRRRVPYAGGGYLRLFPYAAIRACMRHDNRRGDPVNIYIHPREIDPDQPRMDLSPIRRFKYYVGLRSTEDKLRALLRDHRFVSVERYLAEWGDQLSDRVFDVSALCVASGPSPDPGRVPPPPPVGSGVRASASPG
jgi:polysaccharide deacetylase family protein (PEP-CTERM system associated)